MIKKCLECWKEYKTRRDCSKFCCFDCKVKHQRLKDIPCLVCWKMFHPSKSTVKTCSKTCWYKSMALWDRECEFCWRIFTPEHSTNRFCSRECWRAANTFLREIQCPICWKEFKPKNSKTICCSIRCWQIYNWRNKSEEQKQNTIKRLTNSQPEIISKVNRFYEWLLSELWYNIEMEFCLWKYSYDLRVWNILIELNPFAYHNSSWAPNIPWAKPKDKLYHYNKAKNAIDSWYNIIMVWDWMWQKEVINIFKNIKQTIISSPVLHWYNPKEKEHLVDDWYNKDEMLKKWYVEIYDAWEQYIFNSTNLN